MSANTTPFRPAHEPTPDQLERVYTLGVARDLLGNGRGSIAAAFAGDSLKGTVTDVIDLAEFIRNGDVLTHRREDDYPAVTDVHYTQSDATLAEATRVKTPREFAEAASAGMIEAGIGSLILVDEERLLDMPDEKVAEVVATMKQAIKRVPKTVAARRAERDALAAQEAERLRFEDEQRAQAAQAGA